jgi:hypothetical protein
MILAALVVCSILLIEAFLLLELGKQTRGILAHARSALRTLGDRDRSDHEKELCARLASRLILTQTALLTSKLLAIAIVLGLVLAGAVLASRDSEPDLAAALASPVVIVALTLVAVGYAWARNAIVKQL